MTLFNHPKLLKFSQKSLMNSKYRRGWCRDITYQLILPKQLQQGWSKSTQCQKKTCKSWNKRRSSNKSKGNHPFSFIKIWKQPAKGLKKTRRFLTKLSFCSLRRFSCSIRLFKLTECLKKLLKVFSKMKSLLERASKQLKNIKFELIKKREIKIYKIDNHT